MTGEGEMAVVQLMGHRTVTGLIRHCGQPTLGGGVPSEGAVIEYVRNGELVVEWVARPAMYSVRPIGTVELLAAIERQFAAGDVIEGVVEAYLNLGAPDGLEVAPAVDVEAAAHLFSKVVEGCPAPGRWSSARVALATVAVAFAQYSRAAQTISWVPSTLVEQLEAIKARVKAEKAAVEAAEKAAQPRQPAGNWGGWGTASVERDEAGTQPPDEFDDDPIEF